jgi:hypothetical protein
MVCTTGKVYFEAVKTKGNSMLSITDVQFKYYCLQKFVIYSLSFGFLFHHVYITNNYLLIFKGHADSRTCTQIIYNIQSIYSEVCHFTMADKPIAMLNKTLCASIHNIVGIHIAR